MKEISESCILLKNNVQASIIGILLYIRFLTLDYIAK